MLALVGMGMPFLLTRIHACCMRLGVLRRRTILPLPGDICNVLCRMNFHLVVEVFHSSCAIRMLPFCGINDILLDAIKTLVLILDAR